MSTPLNDASPPKPVLLTDSTSAPLGTLANPLVTSGGGGGGGGAAQLQDGAGNPITSAVAFGARRPIDAADPSVHGAWAYMAGAAAAINVPAGGRVLTIAALATAAGASVAINGGTAIPVPAGAGISLAPQGNLVAPAITFTGTVSYFVEYVT